MELVLLHALLVTLEPIKSALLVTVLVLHVEMLHLKIVNLVPLDSFLMEILAPTNVDLVNML